MKNRYKAAIAGYGLFRALTKVVGSRFSGVRAFVMVPELGEKLELGVEYCASEGYDRVTLTRRNWITGARCTLYEGPLTNGRKEIPPRQRE